MTTAEPLPQVVERECRVRNDAGSWHNPTGESLREVDENLWVMERGYVDHGMDVGGKTTIIRLPDGRLFVHSCLPMDTETKAKVDALGTVSAVVAGNLQHIDFVKCWKQYYPDATFLSPPGFMEKREDMPFDAELSTDGTAHESYRDEGGTIQQVFLEGCPAMDETVFFHTPTKTMINTDVMFPFPRNIPFGTKIAKFVLRYGFKPVLENFFVKDRPAYKQGLEKIADWKFERMICCHGAIVEKDALDMYRDWYGL